MFVVHLAFLADDFGVSSSCLLVLLDDFGVDSFSDLLEEKRETFLPDCFEVFFVDFGVSPSTARLAVFRFFGVSDPSLCSTK